jgi:diguanylate cyclase (GGDEF)-like protein
VGAPLGLLALRMTRHKRGWGADAIRGAMREAARDRADYIYVGASTAVVFSIFGFILGRQADRLAALSRTDALTGLSNARGLFERLETELVRARFHQAPLSILVIDLDGLKGINDRYGHRAGDEALRSLADAIRSQSRATDLGARWGGDEFAVLTPNTSISAAETLAERIRALILARSAAWPLSGSIGVATMDPSSNATMDCDHLLRAADTAMYEAKHRGRNCVVLAPQANTSPL